MILINIRRLSFSVIWVQKKFHIGILFLCPVFIVTHLLVRISFLSWCLPILLFLSIWVFSWWLLWYHVYWKDSLWCVYVFGFNSQINIILEFFSLFSYHIIQEIVSRWIKNDRNLALDLFLSFIKEDIPTSLFYN